MSSKKTCPCCGHKTLSEPPGSYEICKVCFWEDDPVQLLDPSFSGGANLPSLMECQANYAEFGVSEQRFLDKVRPPKAGEEHDPFWRPATAIDVQAARAPKDLTDEESRLLSTWHYWLRNVA